MDANVFYVAPGLLNTNFSWPLSGFLAKLTMV